mmetsp:Transcript_11529/g.25620  ORF Transcript_11529/g.25620 Transcript_11529/m.25620 type:complete len:350 (+) Transcript_11529:609-1658(+)
MNRIKPLTRLFSEEKMTKYVPDLVFHGEWLSQNCKSFRTLQRIPPAGHVDSGHEHFMSIRNLCVMDEGFGDDSRFQKALLLKFDSLRYQDLSILDFLSPANFKEAIFRSTTTDDAQGFMRTALENYQLFGVTFSHPDFSTALEPIIASLRKDYRVWSRIQDDYLMYRVSLMFELFSEDVCRQSKSPTFPDRAFPDGKGCAALLQDYADTFTKSAAAADKGDDGWTIDGHFSFYTPNGLANDMKFRSRKRSAAPQPLVGDISEQPTSPPPADVKARTPFKCMFCVANTLGVLNAKGDLITCKNLPGVSHVTDMSQLTKNAATKGATANSKTLTSSTDSWPRSTHSQGSAQ